MKINPATYMLIYGELVNKLGKGNYKLSDRSMWSKIPRGELSLLYKKYDQQSKTGEFYLYTLFNRASNYEVITINDDILNNVLNYIGFESVSNSDGLDTRLKVRVSLFEKRYKNKIKLFLENSLPVSYLPLVKYLVDNEWWFCFKNDSQKDTSENNGLILTYDIIKFDLDAASVLVKKFRKDSSEVIGDLHGFIDFKNSGPHALAINLCRDDKGLSNNEEAYHIKLHIGSLSNPTQEMYLGKFVRHNLEGNILNGSAILINYKAVKKIKFEPGHVNIYDINTPEFFKSISFYFEDSHEGKQISRHYFTIGEFTKNKPEYKQKNIETVSLGPAPTLPTFSRQTSQSSGELIIDYPDEGEIVQRVLLARGRTTKAGSVWIVVRPVGGIRYWVQPKVEVSDDGTWKSPIYIGSVDKGDIGIRSEIRAFLNPNQSLEEGMELYSWPKAESYSEIIEIVRGPEERS